MRNILREEYSAALIASVVFNLTGVAIAAMASAFDASGILLITALIMVGCGFYCSINACRAYSQKRARIAKEAEKNEQLRRELSRASGNPVRFCERFARELEMEDTIDRTRRMLTGDNSVKAHGRGKDEFRRSAEKALRTIYPVW